MNEDTLINCGRCGAEAITIPCVYGVAEDGTVIQRSLIKPVTVCSGSCSSSLRPVREAVEDLQQVETLQKKGLDNVPEHMPDNIGLREQLEIQFKPQMDD